MTHRACNSHSVAFSDFKPRSILLDRLGGLCPMRLTSLGLGGERRRDGEKLFFQSVQVEA